MWDLIGALMPFSFPNKITIVGSSAFRKNLQRLDQPTLANFFAFFEKITTTGSSHFISPNGQGYCGSRFRYVNSVRFIIKF